MADTAEPNGCLLCGESPRTHPIKLGTDGAHTYVPPDTATILRRMRARRESSDA